MGKEIKSPPCGHILQMANDYELVTRDDGSTFIERRPSQMRVRGANSRYCLECDQVVDAQDDLEGGRVVISYSGHTYGHKF